MVIGIAEWLEKVGKFKKTEEKVEALKENDSLELRTVLQAIYDPNVKFDLPEGTPPYKINELVDQEHVFLRNLRNNKILYFIKDFYPNLAAAKREQIFIEMLETVAPADAELLIKMKDKTPIKGITLEIVVKAMKGLIQ